MKTFRKSAAFTNDPERLARFEREAKVLDFGLAKAMEPAARRLEGTEGARMPFWSPDGLHLGFGARSGLKRVPAVDVALGDDVTLGRPTPLFRARIRLEERYNYDVAPDGQLFVISSWIEEESPRAMSLILNWSP